ncbi:aspartate/glutamate racemase family protein [Labrenzia sp. CE80]|uniref:aspartate/glutamate racemase family protein n=1 Tax=Labrenzia sp. CE80 TaxID=1788986 RepID=UPI00129B866D|nr:aspartate/glutamate racemase family protein [Labrenzia sp. CE80]
MPRSSSNTHLCRVALVNPNTSQATTQAMVHIAARAAPEIEIVGFTAASGAELISNEDQLATAAEVVAAMDPLLFNGHSGVIVSAFGDPGLQALQSALDIPVVGIAEQSMARAAQDNRRFSVVTTTPELICSIQTCAEIYGFGAQLMSIRITEGALHETMADPDLLLTRLRNGIDLAIEEDNAEAIIIGGGPLAQAASTLAKDVKVPLVEPVPAAVLGLTALLSRKDLNFPQ